MINALHEYPFFLAVRLTPYTASPSRNLLLLSEQQIILTRKEQASKTENENKAACDKLKAFGIDSKSLRLKTPRVSTALSWNRPPPTASEDQWIRSLADSDFSLSSMFYTVGATSISSDEVLKVAQLKAMREQWEHNKKERVLLLAKRTAEENSKQCLANGPNPQCGSLVGDLRALLKWKMKPKDYTSDKVSSATREKLQQLWEVYWEIEIPDIEVLDGLPEPSVPSLMETEVGCAAERQVSAAISCIAKLSNEATNNMIGKLQEVISTQAAGV